MNRRSFLGGLVTLVGGVALNQSIPLGRVWSFPKNIVVPKNISASIDQYADYVSCQDLLIDSYIDNAVENAATEIGYRAGLLADKYLYQLYDA